MKKIMLMAVAILFSVATVFAANTTNAVSDTSKTKKVKSDGSFSPRMVKPGMVITVMCPFFLV